MKQFVSHKFNQINVDCALHCKCSSTWFYSFYLVGNTFYFILKYLFSYRKDCLRNEKNQLNSVTQCLQIDKGKESEIQWRVCLELLWNFRLTYLAILRTLHFTEYIFDNMGRAKGVRPGGWLQIQTKLL